MFDEIHSMNDSFKERYAMLSELTDKYNFPIIPITPINPIGCRTVDFPHASRGKKPYECMLHFFQDDYIIDRIWNNCERYIPILKNYKYVISPDFSVFEGMPLSLQIYNTHRNRALCWYLMICGINVIPCVEIGGEESWDFVFDGLPKNGTVALTTNGGKQNKEMIESSVKNFNKMIEVLEPKRVVIVGRELDFKADGVEIMYFDSSSQELEKKAREKNGRFT